MTENPVQTEAEGSPTVEVEYAGRTYLLPASLDDCSGDVIDALDNEKVSHALRYLLDDEQWAAFKATKPKVRDYQELFSVYAKRIGLESTGN